MKKCKHKVHTTANEEIGGYNIPDGITIECDIVCAKCGEKLGHWAYGSTNLEYYLKYECKGLKKIKLLFKIWKDRIKYKVTSKKELENSNNNLPF